MNLKTKDCFGGFSLKGLDLSKKTLEAYGSVFDVEDSDEDIIRRGAYKKTISEWGPSGSDRIAHCYQHRLDSPIGKIIELYEDSKGLVFVSEFLDIPLSNDVLKMYEKRVLKEHSVGFQPIKASRIEGKGYDIAEVRLFEISTVTLAANEWARVKSLDRLAQVEWLEEEIKNLSAAIRTGTFTDQTFGILADKLEYYNQKFKEITDSLIKSHEPDKSTHEENEPDMSRIEKMIALKTLMYKI